MAKRPSYKKNVSETLSLELYRDEKGFGIWMDDNRGGSGIEVCEATPEKAGEEIGKYIADYFYNR